MKPTSEQKAIVDSEGDLKINAVAGSGKTSTLVFYAQSRPATAKILYLAFNRTVKAEAIARFKAAGQGRVQVETAHSLAYRFIVRSSRYSVRASNYNPYELSQLLELNELPEAQQGIRGFTFILAGHVARLLALFCNSAALTVRALGYAATVEDPKAKDFAREYEALIEQQTRRALKKMDQAEVEITHDFYLKKFQLLGPELGFDYLLFDEAQDASGAMLDWFLRQRGTKVAVGDTHQQIYAWRGAVNSLEALSFPTLPLNTSFRFAQPVADLAAAVLAYKAPGGTLPPHLRVPLTGAGKSQKETTRAVIGRSNLGLLVKAISYITGPGSVQRLYFEGNLNAYIYGTEGGSLYDVLYLSMGERQKVRDPMMADMASVEELSQYAEQVGDKELKLLLELVETYGTQLFDIIAELKRRHVRDEARATAQMYFSTVHRCKGLEYDLVELTPDFITQDDVLKFHLRTFSAEPPTPGERVAFAEQVNLLYVALTRTRHRLWLPLESLPSGQGLGEGGPLRAYADAEHPHLTAPLKKAPAKKKDATVPAPVRWSREQERLLVGGFCRGLSLHALAVECDQDQDEVRRHIKALQLEQRYGLDVQTV